MEISAKHIQDLRAKTGAGILDCKKALTEEGGDIEKAIAYLRKKGLMAAAKKASRNATEGLVGSYIHAGGKIGVLVEVNAETDFVARNDEFMQFVKDVAMHIAAANPKYLRREDVPEQEIAQEREILLAQIKGENKPANVAEQIVTGRLGKFFGEQCLLEQPFVKEPSKKVEQILMELIARIGENISIRRFVRFGLGEGLEKKQEDFAAEVQKTMANA